MGSPPFSSSSEMKEGERERDQITHMRTLNYSVDTRNSSSRSNTIGGKNTVRKCFTSRKFVSYLTRIALNIINSLEFNSTQRFTDLGKLNFLMMGFRLEPIYTTALAVFKNGAQFKSGLN